MDAGYHDVHLANPAAIKQYGGLKYSDDQHDAFFLSQLLILGILPQGYIYPKKERSVRDLARKRMFLVRHRTAHKLSLQSLIRCCCAHNASADKSRTWRITKQGPPYLRTALVEAAQVIPRMKKTRLNVFFRKKIVP
jgi:transposase